MKTCYCLVSLHLILFQEYLPERLFASSVASNLDCKLLLLSAMASEVEFRSLSLMNNLFQLEMLFPSSWICSSTFMELGIRSHLQSLIVDQAHG